MRPDPLSRDAAGAGWLPLGDAALLAPGVTVPSDAMGDAPWGVDDVVSAFGDTAVYFDPLRIAAPAAADWARSAASDTTRTGRLAKLPVCYGGEFGPDLEGLAERAGLAISEVVRRHHSAEYRVGAVGFRPGFPYLVGLDPRLHTPRLGDPRTTVPAGSVAIGGAYTGVYPEASPGGWNVIGRTPRRMHDPGRQRPALVATGDVVRFRPIDRAAFDELVEPATTQPVTPRHGQPTLRVVSPGAVSVLLTLGQPGRRAEGVTAGGAMDPWSHRLANTLVG
ncbi:MAG: 5-oxoprolinase subunit PxpB, partial [Planctomycetota bacterium]